MRIDALDSMASEIGANLAVQETYTELMGLQSVASGNELSNNSGVRYLKERGWRSSDLYTIVQNLNVGKNKLKILKLMKRADLLQVIRLLSKDKMILGLRFFSKAQLLRLMMMLPRSILIKMLLHLFPLEQLIKALPTRELFAILRSSRLPVSAMMKGFERMDLKYLHFILGKIVGRSVKHLSQKEVLAILAKLKKRQILEGMRFLPFKALVPLVTFFSQQDPALLNSLSQAFLFDTFSRMPKSSLTDAFHILDESIIMKFLSVLPTKFLTEVAAQIDDSVFQQYLISQQGSLLMSIAGAAAA